MSCVYLGIICILLLMGRVLHMSIRSDWFIMLKGLFCGSMSSYSTLIESQVSKALLLIHLFLSVIFYLCLLGLLFIVVISS